MRLFSRSVWTWSNGCHLRKILKKVSEVSDRHRVIEHFRHVQRPFALQPLFGLSGTAHIIVMSDNGRYSSPDEKREQPTIPGTENVRVVHEHSDGSIHWSRFFQFVLLSIGVSTVLFLIANLQQRPLESTPKLFKPTTYEIVPGFFAQSLNSTNDATFDFVPPYS